MAESVAEVHAVPAVADHVAAVVAVASAGNRSHQNKKRRYNRHCRTENALCPLYKQGRFFLANK